MRKTLGMSQAQADREVAQATRAYLVFVEMREAEEAAYGEALEARKLGTAAAHRERLGPMQEAERQALRVLQETVKRCAAPPFPTPGVKL